MSEYVREEIEKMKYDDKYGSVKWDFVKYFKEGKLQTMSAKDCAYKIKSAGGKPMVGQGRFGYLESKYKEPHKIKTYDFGKYSDGVTTATEDNNNSPKKFDFKHIDFKDEKNEIDPVQTDTTDSKYLFDNEDAIVVNFKKKKM